MAAGKNIKWGGGDGMDKKFGVENQDFLKWEWGRVSSCRELYTPLYVDNFDEE